MGTIIGLSMTPLKLLEDVADVRPRETVRAVTTTRAGRCGMSVETARFTGSAEVPSPHTRTRGTDGPCRNSDTSKGSAPATMMNTGPSP
jgi:hypothetical protein